MATSARDPAMAGSRAETGQLDVPVSPAVPGAAGPAGQVAPALAARPPPGRCRGTLPIAGSRPACAPACATAVTDLLSTTAGGSPALGALEVHHHEQLLGGREPLVRRP